jgi:nicotinamide riboside kinase
MRDSLEFDTDFDDDELADVVKRFYAGESDAEMAEHVGADADVITRTRFDLHLLREADTDVPFDVDRLRELRETDATPGELAEELDASRDTIRRCARALDTKDEIRRVNDRYRAEFENALRDRELSERLTSTVHEDGLDEATEGQETDIDF